jgi:hypothetical protein
MGNKLSDILFELRSREVSDLRHCRPKMRSAVTAMLGKRRG